MVSDRHGVLVALLLTCLVGIRLGGPGFWEPTEISNATSSVLANEACVDATCQKLKNVPLAETLARDLAAYSGEKLGEGEWGLKFPKLVLFALSLLAVFYLGQAVRCSEVGLIAMVIYGSFPAVLMSTRTLLGSAETFCGVAMTLAALANILAPEKSKSRLACATFFLAVGMLLTVTAQGVLHAVVVPLYAAAFASFLQENSRGKLLAPVLFGLATLALTGTLAEIFVVQERIPGTRHWLGQSFRVTSGVSSELVGPWASGDTGNVYFAWAKHFRTPWELAAFGMFPAVALVPAALLSLRRDSTFLLLSIVGYFFLSIVLTEKVAPHAFFGFAPCAVMVAVLISEIKSNRSYMRGTAVPLLVLFTGLVLIKDAASDPALVFFSHLPKSPLAYPGTDFAFWIMAMGLAFVVPVVTTFVTILSASLLRGLLLFTGGAVGLWILFVTQVAHPSLSEKLSSKSLFAQFHAHKKDGDQLFVVGDLGDGPRYYAGDNYEKLSHRRKLIPKLASESMVYAAMNASELCPVWRETKGKNIFAIHYTETSKSLKDNKSKVLVSNKLPQGARDKNPLTTLFSPTPPANEKKLVSFKEGLSIVGMKIPSKVSSGDTFEIVLHLRVDKQISRDWKLLVHIDPLHKAQRVNADHALIEGKCASNYWPVGMYVTERFSVRAPSSAGKWKLWSGFFYGGQSNFKNMTVESKTQGVEVDRDNRVALKVLVVN